MRSDAPVPVIGAFASMRIAEKTTLGAAVHIFRTDFDNHEGTLNYATADLQRTFGDSVNVGIGYNYYAIKLRSSNNDLQGFYDFRHRGPVLFLGYRF